MRRRGNAADRWPAQRAVLEQARTGLGKMADDLDEQGLAMPGYLVRMAYLETVDILRRARPISVKRSASRDFSTTIREA